jgi:hypothetical protein
VWLNGTTYTGNASAYDWVGEQLQILAILPTTGCPVAAEMLGDGVADDAIVDSGQLIATDYGTRLILNETNGENQFFSLARKKRTLEVLMRR